MVDKTLDLILSFLTSIKNCEVKKFRSGTDDDTQETSKTSPYQLHCYFRGTLVLSVPSVLCSFLKRFISKKICTTCLRKSNRIVLTTNLNNYLYFNKVK
jgi:hypothetical protein